MTTMPAVPTARRAWPRSWPAALAWALWALALLGLAATVWLDQLLHRGRPPTADRGVEPGQPHLGGGGGERGHGRCGGGQPPAPPSGWLAGGRPWAWPWSPRGGLLVHPVRAGGPAGGAAGRRLPGRVRQRHGLPLPLPGRLGSCCSPPPGRCPRPAGAGGPGSGWPRRSLALLHRGRGTDAAVPRVPRVGNPLGVAALAGAADGRRPGRRAAHPGRVAGRRRVAGAAVPPRPRAGAAAAALAGGGGGALAALALLVSLAALVVGDTDGVVSWPPWRLRGAAAAGHRGGDPALSAVRPGPDHQPHPRLRAADGAAGRGLRRGGARAGPAAGPRTPAWSWPPPPWPWPRCSSRPAAASSRWSTGASTAAATTPPAPSPRSAAACATRSTWTPSPASCWPWSTRPCSQPGRRCGCDHEDHSRQPVNQLNNPRQGIQGCDGLPEVRR